MSGNKRMFKPGSVVEATFRTPIVTFWAGDAHLGRSYVNGSYHVANGSIGVVLRVSPRCGVWVYLPETKTKQQICCMPTYYFTVRHRPRARVRAAVEACVMANEIDAAAQIALDDWMAT